MPRLKIYSIFLLVLLPTATYQSTYAALVTTEVGANAPGNDSENEYVVLFNDGTSTIDLTTWSIADSGSSDDSLSGSLGGMQFLVVSSGATETDLENAWGELIPDSASFLVVSGLSGFNNGTGSPTDGVQLFDSGTLSFSGYYNDSGSAGLATTLANSPDGFGSTLITPFSTIQATSVPEPASLLSASIGCLGIWLRQRRKTSKLSSDAS